MKTLILLLVLTSSLFGQSWKYVGKYQNRVVWVDSSSVKQYRNIATMTFRVKTQNKTNVGRFEFDCALKSIQQIYAQTGFGVVKSWDKPYPVKDKTFGAWLYDRACY